MSILFTNYKSSILQFLQINLVLSVIYIYIYIFFFFFFFFFFWHFLTQTVKPVRTLPTFYHEPRWFIQLFAVTINCNILSEYHPTTLLIPLYGKMIHLSFFKTFQDMLLHIVLLPVTILRQDTCTQGYHNCCGKQSTIRHTNLFLYVHPFNF